MKRGDDLQRVAHHGQGTHRADRRLPERNSETGARIFPTPGASRIQRRGEMPGALPERIECCRVPIKPHGRWAVPTCTGGVEDFIIQSDKTEVFVEPFRVLL